MCRGPTGTIAGGIDVMHLLAVRQDEFNLRVQRVAAIALRCAPGSDVHVVIAGPAFAELPRGWILTQMSPADIDRDHVRKVQIRFGAPEQTGRTVDWIGAIALFTT